MHKFLHSMVRVLDLDRSIEFYARALNLSEEHRLDFPDFTLVYLRAPATDFELELTLNKGRTAPYDLGDGYGHIAIRVDEIEEEHQRLKAQDLMVGDIKTLTLNGEEVGKFFFLTDPDGYKIEVIQRQGRFS